MAKIHQYPLTATDLQDNDFADLDAFDTGTGLYQSKKISGADLKAAIQNFLTPSLVPYSGAIQNVDLGEFGAEAGFIKLDTTPTNTPTDKGTISWNEDEDVIQARLNGYLMKIGEDQFYPVKNQTGSNIAKGVAVQFAGTLGASGRLLIAPFIADGSVPSSIFMGITAEPIANGDDGKVLWFGRIRQINTSAFSDGDILYASTTIAGGFQTTIPQAPNNIVQIAAVVNSHVNNGVIFVRPTIGSNINKDEGVLLTTPTDKQVLQYDSASNLWINGEDLNEAIFTIELIEELTVDFYAPEDLKINSINVISGSASITIEVNNSSYTFGNLIQQGDKITISGDAPNVVNLNSRYE